MSFSCPHYDFDTGGCLKLQTDCVPGRRGCVLARNSVFLVPAEERIKEREGAEPDRDLSAGPSRSGNDSR